MAHFKSALLFPNLCVNYRCVIIIALFVCSNECSSYVTKLAQFKDKITRNVQTVLCRIFASPSPNLNLNSNDHS